MNRSSWRRLCRLATVRHQPSPIARPSSYFSVRTFTSSNASSSAVAAPRTTTRNGTTKTPSCAGLSSDSPVAELAVAAFLERNPEPVQSLSLNSNLNAAEMAEKRLAHEKALQEIDIWASTLREHWFVTCADVAELSDDEAKRMKMPVRLASLFRSAALRVISPSSSRATAALAAATSEPVLIVGASSSASSVRTSAAAGSSLDVNDSASFESARAGIVSAESGESVPERFLGGSRGFRVTGRERLEHYALTDRDIGTNARLAKELQDFERWMTRPFYGQLEDPVRPVTAQLYVNIIHLALGWLVRWEPERCVSATSSASLRPKRRGRPKAGSLASTSVGAPKVQDVVTSLSLSDLFPQGSAEHSAELAFAYVQFLRSERKVSANFERKVIAAFVKLAKHLFHAEVRGSTSPVRSNGSGSVANMSSLQSGYNALPVVLALRALGRDASKRGRVAQSVSNDELKWLAWPEFLAVKDHLLTELNNAETEFVAAYGDPVESSLIPPSADAAQRQHAMFLAKNKGVAKRYLRYLMCGILAEVPDRQRTLRELRVGHTLVRTTSRHPGAKDGETSRVWAIQHGPNDYKTGAAYGPRPLLPLSQDLSHYIDRWNSHWRGVLVSTQEDHGLLLCNTEGAALSEANVFDTISSTTYRLTGRRMNPHKVRDSVVTFLRDSDASERELEALATLMGHSVTVQKSHYDKRTKDQRVTPAFDLLRNIRPATSLPAHFGARMDDGDQIDGQEGPKSSKLKLF